MAQGKSPVYVQMIFQVAEKPFDAVGCIRYFGIPYVMKHVSKARFIVR